MSPRVSVIVPTYRRTDLLERCLGALAAQRLPASDFEIIVADDGLSAATRAACERWRGALASRGGPTLRYCTPARHGGPAAARNAGARLAAGAILAFTDDDTLPEPEWLERGLAAFGPGIAAAWGRLVMPLSPVPTDYERDAARLAHAPFVTANCFCTKRVFAGLGGFDERFRLAWREDSDLYFRLLAAGAAIVHVPEAVVMHPVRPACWGVALTQQKKILFDALLFKKHPTLYRERIRRTPRWDYYAIVLALLVCVAAAIGGAPRVAAGAGVTWLLLTAALCAKRLGNARKTPTHVAEMIVTSAAIPPLAVFWRAAGALKFRVPFV
jgi:glycosyltransferase involved in cell wall biosynthesis